MIIISKNIIVCLNVNPENYPLNANVGYYSSAISKIIEYLWDKVETMQHCRGL